MADCSGVFTDQAIKAMKRFKKNGTPFFLAVGYKTQHLSFTTTAFCFR